MNISLEYEWKRWAIGCVTLKVLQKLQSCPAKWLHLLRLLPAAHERTVRLYPYQYLVMSNVVVFSNVMGEKWYLHISLIIVEL